ncbi:MAG: hypothetical protein H6852_13800 [Geminicoccaceae bacterium]|jgi:hypothetical protein|nr:hypothetical protein [Geminicoccaceae bacterium]
MERDISWAEDFKPIDEFQALHMVETATGWPSRKAEKWLLQKIRSDRVRTQLKESCGYGKISDNLYKSAKESGTLSQLHISSSDLATALDEFYNDSQDAVALLSRLPLAGTSEAPRPIKLLDGLSARRRVEEAAQWKPEEAQVWLCHALVAGRVRGWHAASAKEAFTPELDPTEWPISFSESMPISENGGSLNFYLGKVCVDAESLSEALLTAFPRQEGGAQEAATTVKRGRPPKDYWPRLYVEAGAWLAHNGGEDETGGKSALAEFLMTRATAHGSGLERSQAFKKSKEILDAFRRLRSDGAL